MSDVIECKRYSAQRGTFKWDAMRCHVKWAKCTSDRRCWRNATDIKQTQFNQISHSDAPNPRTLSTCSNTKWDASFAHCTRFVTFFHFQFLLKIQYCARELVSSVRTPFASYFLILFFFSFRQIIFRVSHSLVEIIWSSREYPRCYTTCANGTKCHFSANEMLIFRLDFVFLSFSITLSNAMLPFVGAHTMNMQKWWINWKCHTTRTNMNKSTPKKKTGT